MKKSIAIILALSLMLIITSCGKKPEAPASNPNETAAKAEEANKEAANKEQQERQQKLLSLLAEGKAPNVEFPIGTKTSEIISKWGEPEAKDFFMGGLFIVYGNVTYFTDATDESGKVAVIGIMENTEIFGVKIGMTFDEIKNVLGENYTEAKTSEEDELYNGDWSLVYQNGDYKVTFMAPDKNAATNAAYIEKK